MLLWKYFARHKSIHVVFTFSNSTTNKLFIVYIPNIWLKSCPKRHVLCFMSTKGVYMTRTQHLGIFSTVEKTVSCKRKEWLKVSLRFDTNHVISFILKDTTGTCQFCQRSCYNIIYKMLQGKICLHYNKRYDQSVVCMVPFCSHPNGWKWDTKCSEKQFTDNRRIPALGKSAATILPLKRREFTLWITCCCQSCSNQSRSQLWMTEIRNSSTSVEVAEFIRSVWSRQQAKCSLWSAEQMKCLLPTDYNFSIVLASEQQKYKINRSTE
jgi:hypothetical protein